MAKDKILVVGGGSWGTSFANYLANSADPKKREVKIWIREKEVIDTIRSIRENPIFLPDIKISPWLTPVHRLKKEAAAADIIVFAVPSKFIRDTFKELKNIAKKKDVVLVLGAGDVNKIC